MAFHWQKSVNVIVEVSLICYACAKLLMVIFNPLLELTENSNMSLVCLLRTTFSFVVNC